MRFYVAGNSYVKGDDGAVKLLPFLKAQFPKEEFVEFDPNEEFEGEDVNIIDVVKGIESVEVFVNGDIDKLSDFPKVSMHDFDLSFKLKLLINLGIIRNVRIIGIPYGEKADLKELYTALEKVISYAH